MVNYTVNGQCPNDCGRCCTSVLPMNEKEVNKIKKYIQRNNIIPTNPNSDIRNEEYKDVCPFLNSDNRCKIYIHRPEVCRRFTCDDKPMPDFNHIDKRLVLLMKEFYPDEPCYGAPDIEKMNVEYHLKKEQAYGKTKYVR